MSDINIHNEINKINNQDSIFDFNLILNDSEITDLNQDDRLEINKIDSLLDYDFFYDSQFHH